MKRKYNKGVTLVEVLIALAVFLILMIPLVSSLITSVKTTDSGKELQTRNDFAEVLMENVKNAPIDDLRDSTKVSRFFPGSENVTLTPSAANSTDFTIEGATYLGTTKKKYSYKIEATLDKKTDAHGIMDDLDPYKSAFIPVTFSNYDDVASEALVTQRLQNGTDPTIFLDTDKVKSLRTIHATRGVKVSMSGSKATGFTVECELSYMEAGRYIIYKPYKQTFENTVPNIYIMYNSGVYNNLSTVDTIEFDLSGITSYDGFGKKERINAFIIRTSDDYTNIIDDFQNSDGTFDDSRFSELTDVLSEKLKNDITDNKNNGSGSTKLYKESSSGGRNNNVTVRGASAVSEKRFKVYHNLFYTDASGTNQSLVTIGNNMTNNIESIDNAQEETWNIYNVKVWIQQGDSVTDSAEMITLQGTRGGGEIE